MFHLLEQLRQKPVGTRKRVAFLCTFAVVGLIFVLWAATIVPGLVNDQEQIKKTAEYAPTPASTFGESMKVGLSKIGEQIGDLKTAVTTFTTEPIHYTASTTKEEDNF